MSKPLAAKAHLNFALRFLRQGLSSSHIEHDATRLIIAFYCIAILDVLGLTETSTTEDEREEWRSWLWQQQTRGPWGVGFRAGPYSSTKHGSVAFSENEPNYDSPMLIMTYGAILSLAILRDPFTQLDREGLVRFLRTCQKDDGGFVLYPGHDERDLRMTYCAFSICAMLGDWSAINVERAIEFIQQCRTYEGGYGQAPFNEAQGGTTYCALASLYLIPASLLPPSLGPPLSQRQREQTIRWLISNQGGGFRGRTEKEPDTCYCWWCGAALQIIGARPLMNQQPITDFILASQNRFAGIAKNPGAGTPDPFHTYLALASLALPSPAAVPGVQGGHDALLNASTGTVGWIREKLTIKLDEKGAGLVGEKYSSIPGGFGGQGGEEESPLNQCRIL